MDAGKCRTFCFDKTGCLTEEYIEILGILPSTGSMIHEKEEFMKKENEIYIKLMASCHDLNIIGSEVVG
jgi:magnesium-transporting ATPase (P-type)